MKNLMPSPANFNDDIDGRETVLPTPRALTAADTSAASNDDRDAPRMKALETWSLCTSIGG